MYKPRIICKGYNSPYKQGPTATLHSYKYQVSSNPQHNPIQQHTSNKPMHISLSIAHSSLYLSIYLFYL